MADLLHLVAPDRVQGLARLHRVDAVAVGPGDDGGVIGGLGPALDLDGIHARPDEVGQVVDHAHVAGVHDVRPLLVLVDGEVFSWSLFLDQGVLIPAGLGAGAPVGVPARHIVGEQTAAGVGHAHGPVAKGLDLQVFRGLGADLCDLVQAQLTG